LVNNKIKLPILEVNFLDVNDLEQVDSAYLKRFNDGYQLASQDPKLAASLENLTNDSLEAKGLKAGIKQRFLEIEQEKRPQWLKEHSENKETIKDPNKDLDADNRPGWLKEYRENMNDYSEPDIDKDDIA
jgi:hypothetical protein